MRRLHVRAGLIILLTSSMLFIHWNELTRAPLLRLSREESRAWHALVVAYGDLATSRIWSRDHADSVESCKRNATKFSDASASKKPDSESAEMTAWRTAWRRNVSEVIWSPLRGTHAFHPNQATSRKQIAEGAYSHCTLSTWLGIGQRCTDRRRQALAPRPTELSPDVRVYACLRASEHAPMNMRIAWAG